MQLLSFHSEMRTLQSDMEGTKNKIVSLFDERMIELSMLQMQKRLKAESWLSKRIGKVEDRVTLMETTLHALVNGTIHTNKLLQ